MQQPMNQPEPIGGQQAVQQQMVLCPVRFVYETQVLVQPDQIQPNQTFFINPQNPPPWMQNRPQPNPVVYVQQLPNNMIQPVQQQMDQNQLYLQQNFANFQLQQHMLAQNHQDMRSMQLANIVPNMVQNVQQSIQSNERNINQNPNTGQMQANTQNMMQNQMTVARQVPNQGNQNVEVQRQVQFMNVRPQMTQQMNMTRPVMSLNQLQNMQAMTNMQNLQIQQANAGQTFVQNIGQRMPQNVNAVRPQMMHNNAMNVQNVNNINKPTNQPPQEVNKTMNNTAGSPVPNVRNFAQNYNCRPIQPRRRFVENNANVPKMQQQNTPVQQPKIQQQNVPQVIQQQQHIPVQTPPTQQQHQYNQERMNSHQIATNTAAVTNYLNNPNISRKRKSESPDETQNKMAVPPASQPIYKNQQGIIITKLCNEIGTNTSPVHKPKLNANNPSNQAVQINQSTPMVIVENAEQSKQDGNQIKTETRTVITPAPSESDKLIRNTVYTQARGRLLQDKISDNIPQQVIENKSPESVQNTTETKTNIEPQTDNDTAMTEVPTDKVITVTIQSEKGATVTKAQADTIESRILQILDSIPKNKNTQTPEKKPREVKKEEVCKEIKVEGVKSNESSVSNEDISANKTIKIVETTKSEPKSETQEEKIEVKEQTPEVKVEKLAVSDKVVTKQDILTHVVDGYVIQESNFAFPIRKPLIEKTLQANPKAEAGSMDALKECMKEEMKNTGVDVQLLPFHYLLLHCEKKKEEEEMADSKTLNPFTDLLHSTVKSWTITETNKPQSSNTEVTAPPIEVQEKVIEEGSKTEEPAPTEVKEDEKVVQEENVTEEPSPTEVTEEVAVVQEKSATEEPTPMEVKEDVENGDFNPFARLQQSAVKSWTVEDVSNYLLKCNWEETASLLHENEIDGASLFMVTKAQLMIIGVNEEQAEVISEFVQSGSSKGN